MEWWRKRKITEKTRRLAASSGTIPTCENAGVTRPGIEPCWEASRLTSRFWHRTVSEVTRKGSARDKAATSGSSNCEPHASLLIPLLLPLPLPSPSKPLSRFYVTGGAASHEPRTGSAFFSSSTFRSCDVTPQATSRWCSGLWELPALAFLTVSLCLHSTIKRAYSHPTSIVNFKNHFAVQAKYYPALRNTVVQMGLLVKKLSRNTEIVYGWKEHLKSNPVIPIKTPYDRVKRCRERKINIKASERINVDVFTQNKRPFNLHLHCIPSLLNFDLASPPSALLSAFPGISRSFTRASPEGVTRDKLAVSTRATATPLPAGVCGDLLPLCNKLPTASPTLICLVSVKACPPVLLAAVNSVHYLSPSSSSLFQEPCRLVAELSLASQTCKETSSECHTARCEVTLAAGYWLLYGAAANEQASEARVRARGIFAAACAVINVGLAAHADTMASPLATRLRRITRARFNCRQSPGELQLFFFVTSPDCRKRRHSRRKRFNFRTFQPRGGETPARVSRGAACCASRTSWHLPTTQSVRERAHVSPLQSKLERGGARLFRMYNEVRVGQPRRPDIRNEFPARSSPHHLLLVLSVFVPGRTVDALGRQQAKQTSSVLTRVPGDFLAAIRGLVCLDDYSKTCWSLPATVHEKCTQHTNNHRVAGAVLRLKAVHDKASTFEINLRKMPLPLRAYILTGVLSIISPVMLVTMDFGGCTTEWAQVAVVSNGCERRRKTVIQNGNRICAPEPHRIAANKEQDLHALSDLEQMQVCPRL
ncbi:hypothetical protein PR048_017292 [Dryococelus australis]|uniref:Uncharacterized protein n=1 Tax=Dryococelus australis TaxID=614101 RepID=A0ABQ9H9C2_9NEOP|nr:hypothetical protein PR048_017292 [Dryococelus australis]